MPDVKAEAAKHDIRAISFPIIYSLMKWVLNYLTSLLPPVLEYDVVGVAEVPPPSECDVVCTNRI